MNISYDLLRSYVSTDLTPEEVAAALTSIGLETGSIEQVESIPGGLKGLVIGKVLTCDVHENSDHLHVTTVDIGAEAPLQIVCGAPNVAAGKGVVVATLGTILHSGDETFTIKKSKIRGVESFGMLCSEVEIGIGKDNSGIILLDANEITVGMPAAEHFGVTSDYVLEVDITPNRVDATSHYGVARDLAAYLSVQTKQAVQATRPQILARPLGACPVAVQVDVTKELCPRFEGVVIRGVRVTESPEWLRRRLETLGLKPINNVVDVTNFVLHEFGQPLHAYDLNKVGKDGLRVCLAREGKVTLLDHSEASLTGDDLIIASASDHTPLCVAGVMGALNSGTTEETTEIFLESANFNASSVRKTARRLGVSSDSSFRFERGLDPNNTEWALLRASKLILDLCPGSYVDGGVFDHYPAVAKPYEVELSLERMTRLLGLAIPVEDVKRILTQLEIEIVKQEGDLWQLRVPRYRIDVTREVDVIEDILRIYGYNRVELSGYIHANLSAQSEVDRAYSRRLLLSEQLTGAGFNELLNNSLSSESYYEGLTSFPKEKLVQLLNPLSGELNVLRQTPLCGGLSTISRNLRRQQKSFYYYEWGNCYTADSSIPASTKTLAGYRETETLGLWLAGEHIQNSWAHPDETASPFELKAHVLHLFDRLGISPSSLKVAFSEEDIFAGKALTWTTHDGKQIAILGRVAQSLVERWEIDLPVYFTSIDWTALSRLAERVKTVISDLPKFPIVRRDLSLLIGKEVTFAELAEVARRAEKKLLKDVTLFDVYEGKNLPEGKKSYALTFSLQDTERTMSDKQIDAIMAKIQTSLKDTFGAELR